MVNALGLLGILLVALLRAPQVENIKTISEGDCTAARLGTAIPTSAIGEPVSGVALSPPRWIAPAERVSAHCSIDGSMAPIDRSPAGRPIQFRVLLPATWSRRSAQMGGSGPNGVIPNLTGEAFQRNFVTYGSDSGHQIVPAPRGGTPNNAAAAEWYLNDEAIRNFGYMQMKKTHDAAMVLIERMYGERPAFNYYIGNSQGGREGLEVAQRYPADYDGVSASVPVVSISSILVAPVLMRIHERPMSNWVPPAKANAIRTEFVRQCDKLDGLADGIINNYMACRAIFDVSMGARNRDPWQLKRCPNNVDPNPADASANACLTNGQISTLHFVYSRYPFKTSMPHNARSFGMWLPTTDPAGGVLMVGNRVKGQEGASEDAPMLSQIGAAAVSALFMGDPAANPLEFSETAVTRRRREVSAIFDSANPDLTRFHRRQGKLIVTIGTNDNLASPGAQLDYYQAVVDKMGQATVDQFARFFVMPQAGHGLSGTNYSVDGEGKTIPTAPIPNAFNRLDVLIDWVEKKIVPGKSLTVTAGARSLPLCSYPAYPKYVSGDVAVAASYTCALK